MAQMLTKKEQKLLARKERKEQIQRSNELFKKGLTAYKNAKTKAGYTEAAEFYTLAISLRNNNARYFFARANCFRMMVRFS